MDFKTIIHAPKQFKFILFGDDTNIIYSSNTVDNVGVIVNKELELETLINIEYKKNHP